MRASAGARIRSAALRHNLAEIRRHAPGHLLMAVVKADAYGHGLVESARALDGADAFAVARVEEAMALRAAGLMQRVVLLEGVFGSDDLSLAARERFDIVVHSEEQIAALADASLPRQVDVWLKLDTGMHRLGIEPAELPAAAAALGQSAAVGRLRLMTHFAQAEARDDPMTVAQIGLLAASAEAFDGAVTLANSAAVLAWRRELESLAQRPREHGEHWIRPGIALYGISPFPDRTGPELGLRPVMDFHTVLIAVKTVRAGERIGYGGRFLAETDMRVGVAAAGYGDGYPWSMPDGTPVLVRGRRAPLAGRVSMDMITIDLSAVPEARTGDEVLLWGEGLPAEEIAAAAGTIPYELVCRVSRRVPRTRG